MGCPDSLTEEQTSLVAQRRNGDQGTHRWTDLAPLPTVTRERQEYIRTQLEELGILETEPHGR